MIRAMADAPARSPLRRPALFIATLSGVGYAPRAPGTAGSLVALPFAWLIARSWGTSGLVVAASLLFVLGWWAASIATQILGKDPSAVVVDEAVGQWLTLAAAPLDPWLYLAGFALFRLFDVWKPWPVGWADQRVGGGLGVMLDDVLAAFYAACVLLLARFLLGR
jgi:phosphatidylglycerophosphatase A